MSAPYARAPHVGDRHFDPAPQAALLIDFDNVTLGRGSDLTKELRTLLDSEIITSKVAVQRAYADWRRYPQYIVPLSEASIDLIFAPAYGSSKKNATDIRMAIDAIELVFVRPEIGTYILLTGDSDFSSVVLKLKEYGKYVIGVGIQESSSDILVQNCDEYYSYTALTGLTKTSEATRVQFDPWVLVEEAVKKMTERRDVMRSDRLKQVMREIDKGFNEAEHGFPKFSKFLAEAASKGLVKLRKMENGQYEVSAGKKKRGGRSRREETPRQKERPTAPPPSSGDPIQDAYSLLRVAMGELASDGGAARDSDVKRRILVLEPNFDEAELGFPKFSLFLRQAEAHQVVSLNRKEPEGYTEVTLLKAVANDGAATPHTPFPPDAAATASPPLGSDSPVAVRGRRTRPRRATSSPDAEAAPKPTESTTEAAERAERRQERDRGDRTRGSSRGRGGRRGRGGTTERQAVDEGHEAVELAAQAPTPEPELSLKLEDNEPATAAAVETPEIAQPVVAEPAVAKTEVFRPESVPEPEIAPAVAQPSRSASTSRTLHPRQQSRRRGPDGPPPLFEGQGVSVGSTQTSSSASSSSQGSSESQTARPVPSSSAATFHGLPTESGAIQRYLTHRYKGVGEKTAEQVVEAFGSEVFSVMDSEPERVAQVLSEHRAEALLEAWQADKARRSEATGSATT